MKPQCDIGDSATVLRATGCSNRYETNNDFITQAKKRQGDVRSLEGRELHSDAVGRSRKILAEVERAVIQPQPRTHLKDWKRQISSDTRWNS